MVLNTLEGVFLGTAAVSAVGFGFYIAKGVIGCIRFYRTTIETLHMVTEQREQEFHRLELREYEEGNLNY